MPLRLAPAATDGRGCVQLGLGEGKKLRRLGQRLAVDQHHGVGRARGDGHARVHHLQVAVLPDGLEDAVPHLADKVEGEGGRGGGVIGGRGEVRGTVARVPAVLGGGGWAVVNRKECGIVGGGSSSDSARCAERDIDRGRRRTGWESVFSGGVYLPASRRR